jgi:hypothetical protein
MQNVVYRDGAMGSAIRPHQTLLKTSIGAATNANAAQAPIQKNRVKQTSKIRGASALKEAAKASRRAVRSQRLLVMSAWRPMNSSDETLLPGMTLTVMEGDDSTAVVTRATFAAVPTPAGWLIFQL